MWRKKLIISVVLSVLFISVLVPSQAEAATKKKVAASRTKSSSKKKKGPYQVSAASALLFDVSGGRKYYARNIDKKVLPASTTKVVTVMVVLDRLKMDDVVTVPQDVVQTLPSKIDLQPGEQYYVRDLLYAALLNSANDASVALAVAAAGSQEKFVQLMNQKAQQAGAQNTVFANPHGLPSKAPQYTTAYDMFMIFRAALKNEFFSEAIKIRTMAIQSLAGRSIALKSHNKAFFKGWKAGVYGKTGYTRSARACFVGMLKKGQETMIVAVFGCPGSTRWNDIKFIIEKYGAVDL